MDQSDQTLSLDAVRQELELLKEENARLRKRISVPASALSADENLLQESETRYKNFIDNSHDLIQSVNPDGTFDFVNAAWLETLGYTEEELRGLNFTDIIHESSLDHCMALFQQIMLGEQFDSVEAMFKAKSGEPVKVKGKIRVRKKGDQVIATHGIFENVTARESLSGQIEEWAQVLEMMYKQASVGIGLYSVDGQILRVNDKFAQIVQFEREEIAGMYMADFKDQAAVDLVKGEIAKMQNHNSNHFDFEGFCKQKDGCNVATHLEIFPIRDGEGEITCLFGVLTDLDELESHKAQVKAKDRMIASILESTHEMYWEIDQDFVYTWVSPRIEEIYGFTATEIVGTRGEKLFDKPDFEEHIDEFYELSQNPRPYRDALLKCRKKTGERIYVRCSGFPYFDEAGDFSGLRGSHVDDTKAQKAARRIAASENRYREIVEQSSSWFWESNAEGVITYVSQNIENLTGFTPEEIIGNKPKHFKPYDPSHASSFGLDILLNSEAFEDVLFRITDKFGRKKTFASSGTPRFDNDGVFIGFRGNDRDVTEKIEAVEKLSASESWLIKSQAISKTGSWRMHPDTREVTWSAGVFNLIGVEPFALEPNETTLASYVVDGQQELLVDRIEALSNLEPLADIEFQIRAENGQIKWLRSHVEKGLDGNGCVHGILRDITEDKEQQAALEASEERFRNIVESSNTYFWEIGLDKKFTYISRNVEDILGYPSNDLVGEHLVKMIGEHEMPKTEEVLCSVLQNREEVKDYQALAFHKNGAEITLMLNAMPLLDDAGRIKAIRGSCTDISEYLSLSQKVKEIDQLQDVLFRQNNIGVALLDLDGKWLQVNTKLQNLLGYSLKELRDMTFLDVTAPEFVSTGRKNIAQVSENELPHLSLAKQYVRKDGSRVWCLVDAFSIYDENGKPKYMYALVKDIDAERTAQQELERREVFLQLSQEISRTGSWRYNVESGDLEWSDGYFRIFGYDPKSTEANLDLFWSHIYPADLDSVQDSFERFMTKGDIDNGEFRIIDTNGNVKHILTYTLPSSDGEGGKEFVGALLDITSIREKEIELHKLLHDLKISNEELEQFAYVASHDLQEPIRLINTYASMLDERLGGQLDDTSARYFQFIQDSSMRMRDLVRGLLDFSLVGNHTMQIERTDLSELIEPVALTFTKEVNEYGTNLIYEQLGHVLCDKLQMSRLLQNLVGNAIKFSRDKDKPEVRISCKDLGSEFEVSVADNGIGIKAENLDKIFTIFKRLNNKEAYDGHGLGMSVAKKIVDMHNGKIWAESEFGQGTTVKFTLPKKA